VLTVLRDPDGSWSSTRVAAMLCTVVGCALAVWGMAVNREQAATVAALLGGGAASFFARNKSVAP
jgi:hypothetical protein